MFHLVYFRKFGGNGKKNRFKKVPVETSFSNKFEDL